MANGISLDCPIDGLPLVTVIPSYAGSAQDVVGDHVHVTIDDVARCSNGHRFRIEVSGSVELIPRTGPIPPSRR